MSLTVAMTSRTMSKKSGDLRLEAFHIPVRTGKCSSACWYESIFLIYWISQARLLRKRVVSISVQLAICMRIQQHPWTAFISTSSTRQQQTLRPMIDLLFRALRSRACQQKKSTRKQQYRCRAIRNVPDRPNRSLKHHYRSHASLCGCIGPDSALGSSAGCCNHTSKGA